MQEIETVRRMADTLTQFRPQGQDMQTQVTMDTHVVGVALPPGVSPAECADLCRQWGAPPSQLINSLETEHRLCLSRCFTPHERHDLEILFNFAARVLRDAGREVRLLGNSYINSVRRGDFGTPFETMLTLMVDQMADGDVNDVMLEQTMPATEGETPSRGAVGGSGRSRDSPIDVDAYEFSAPDPDFDIDTPGPYDMWRDPYQ